MSKNLTIKFVKVKYEIKKSDASYVGEGLPFHIRQYYKNPQTGEFVFRRDTFCSRRGVWNMVLEDFLSLIKKFLSFKNSGRNVY